MGAKINKLRFEEAVSRMHDFQYALVYNISSMFFGKTADMAETDWEECLEMRLFDEEKELHFFRQDEEWKAVLVSDDGCSDDEVSGKYELEGHYRALGIAVKIKQYIRFDEDGQACVFLTRLVGVE